MPDFSPFLDLDVQDLLKSRRAPDDDGLEHHSSLTSVPAMPVSSINAYGSTKGVQLPGQRVSTAFNPTMCRDSSPVDTVLRSSDGTLFTVNRRTVLESSSNNLNGLLLDHDVNIEDGVVFSVPETEKTTAVLRKYGLKPASVLARGQPLYEAFLFVAPIKALDTYALAAFEGLEELAVAVSAYTLDMKLLDHIPSEVAEAMGASYFHRLLQLHGKRLAGLRKLLEARITPHEATPHCSAMNQQVICKAFELATAQIFYEATPGLSHITIETVFSGLIEGTKCRDCQQTVRIEVDNMIAQWALLERTI